MFEWQELLKDLLYVVITVLLPVLVTYLSKYLKAQFDRVRESTDKMVFSNTITESLELIMTAVNYTSQTYVDALKKEGKFDEESQRKAFEMTKEAVLKHLSEESMDIIAALYGDVNSWIDLQIESAVRDNKSK